MKAWFFFITLLFVSGCSNGPLRDPASADTDYVFGEVDSAKSLVRQFPPDVEQDHVRHNFFLQLKNAQGAFVDVEDEAIVVMGQKKEKLSYKLERFQTGRYYVVIEKKGALASKHLDFLIHGKPLKTHFPVKTFQKPKKEYSKIEVVEELDTHKVKLRLTLKDKARKPASLSSNPEILLQGNGLIQDLVPVGEGVWEFSLSYPEYNQILYLSIRADGTYFKNLYRLQHVEK